MSTIINDRQVCEAYAKYKAFKQSGPHIKFADEFLQEMTGRPHDECYIAMEEAAGRDLIDYGVSLRSGWLTEKGKHLLSS